MADEAQAAVNDGASGSASEADQQGSAQTPADEQSVAKTPDNKVPYDRFSDVVAQRNKERQLREQYEARIRELETRLPTGSQSVDASVERLKARGIDPKVAQAMAEEARAIASESIAPLKREAQSREVAGWMSDIRRSDPDYKEIQPELEKAFNDMSPQEQMQAVSSPKSLEWFYKSVKSDAMAAKVAKAREAGVKQGYDAKVLKEGMGSGPKSASSQDGELTMEKILALSPEDYRKRLPEINAAVNSGRFNKKK